MKKIIIFIAILAFGNDTKEILNLINILKTKSFDYKEISNIYNPFVKTTKSSNIQKKSNIILMNPTKTDLKYTLEVIFQNKVRINNSWYKNYDKIDNYTIIIRNNKVYLKNKNKTILLNRKTIIKVK